MNASCNWVDSLPISSSGQFSSVHVLRTNLKNLTALPITAKMCLSVVSQISVSSRVSCIDREKGSPYLIAENRVPELIPVLGSQPAGDASHKPGGRLPLLSARPPAGPPQPLRGLLPISLLDEQRYDGCEQFA